jgi:KDO2-lipid IV(A) lauroyltransferase
VRRSKPLENWLTRQFLYTLQQTARWAPDGARAPMGAGLGRALSIAVPKMGRSARANLAHAYPELSALEIERLTRRCFWHLGQTLFEFLQMPNWDKAEIMRRVKSGGTGHLDAALAAGKGAILISAHYGNWELAAARLAAAGYPLRVIVRSADDAGAEALLQRVRTGAGYQVISRKDGTREALAALRRNEVLVVLLDQNTSQAEVFVQFFGRPAATASGPAVLARRTGARLVPGFIRRLPDGTHYGEVLAPIEWEATGDPEREVLDITQQLTAAIEAWIRVEPEQWLWMHRRWRRKPPTSPAASPAPPTADMSCPKVQ